MMQRGRRPVTDSDDMSADRQQLMPTLGVSWSQQACATVTVTVMMMMMMSVAVE